MASHRTRVGLHARNDVLFTEADYALVRTAQIETMKMMSFTDASVFERLRRENGGIDFIVRLYDDRIHRGSYPTPAAFVSKMVPAINRLQPYTAKFEIHNEPNHADGIEGWGASDGNARAFLEWYMAVLPALKKACPWASFGFPGLALNQPHRDLAWLEICRKAILASDWLGCHTYWQYGNMMSDDWGLRFKRYHELFPHMPIEITEFGNSTPNLPREEMARQYAQYYQALNHYPYLGSASAFIASSPDPTWAIFVWLKESGEMMPVVQAVRNMARTAVEIPPPPPVPKPKPKPEPQPPVPTEPKPKPQPPAPAERTFPETGKTVRGTFLKFLDKYGLAICGYPITELMEEDGVPVQYFQRLALTEPKPGKVAVMPTAAEAWAARQRIARLEALITEMRKRVVGGAAVAKPPIEDIVDTLPAHTEKRYPTRTLLEIQRIIIHHSGTSPTITARRLAEDQVHRDGMAGMSYHFLVTADGKILLTSTLQTATDHAFGQSWDSIGVCFAGNFADEIPTHQQMEAGARLCAWLLDHLHLTAGAIVGLNELFHSQSPGDQWLTGQRWKDKLLTLVAAHMAAAAGEDPSAHIASLREQIQVLQTRLESLEKETSPSPSNVPAAGFAEGLGAVVVPLQAQIQAYQREMDKSAITDKPPAGDPSFRASDSAGIGSLDEELQQIQTEAANMLKIEDEKLAEFVAQLQAKIASLQKELELQKSEPSRIGKPPIQDMTGTLLKHAAHQYGTRPRTAIKTLVIHHSAVAPKVGPQQIAAYHVNKLDWPGAGYHYIVGEDGTIYQANSVETVSYHAAKANPYTVGICFLGNFDQAVPPPAQLLAGARLVAWLMQEFNVDLAEVKGHRELMGTACPGAQWLGGQNWKQMLQQEIVRVQQGGLPDPGQVATPKSMNHYMLFWARDGQWALDDWLGAQAYIGTFRPSAGFSAEDASLAEYVTIVGGPLGVPRTVEEWLKEQGCKVDRVAGKDQAETEEMLTALAERGERFWSIDG